MTGRRLAVLVAGVTALLAVVAIASHGRPLSGHQGQGPSAIFFDYAATTLLLAAIVMAAVVGWAIFGQRFGGGGPRGRWHFVSTLFSLFVAAFISWAVLHSHIEDRLRQLGQHAQKQPRSGKPLTGPKVNPNGRNARVRWDEIVVVLVLLGGTGLVLYARRRALRPPRRWLLHAEEVSHALDDSLDDLRNDPDLRRAIIAAYARMERALAAVGIGRRPSEAPFEFMERALTSLETSAESAERLTELFEWAKFSHHEPRPEMREDAIDALVAVRDELRRPAAEPVPA